MPYFVRPRNSGRTFELRVKHGRLPKPVYRNFDLQEDAQRGLDFYGPSRIPEELAARMQPTDLVEPVLEHRKSSV